MYFSFDANVWGGYKISHLFSNTPITIDKIYILSISFSNQTVHVVFSSFLVDISIPFILSAALRQPPQSGDIADIARSVLLIITNYVVMMRHKFNIFI